MAWYDVFARVYDASLEPHYRAQRHLAAEALGALPGETVLDLPCGTGQSFPALLASVGVGGQVIGVDLSAGMLREAQRRAGREGFSNVRLLQEDVASLDEVKVGGRPDRIHVFLGMSVFPDPERAFAALWAVLRPGGSCVLVDVHAEVLGLQGRLVNWTAQADIRRRFWEPLERMALEFDRQELPSKPLHGGRIFLARGRKPSD